MSKYFRRYSILTNLLTFTKFYTDNNFFLSERMPDSEYRDPAISLRRRLMFLNYDYLEDRDRSFGRGAEFAGSDTVTVDEDIDEDDDEEDDEPYDDPEEETENEEDGDVWDDDGELAENDEDDASNTESSESDEYG